ncbi:MAG TPA: hypothetical protein VEK75_04025 [Xanthobacteraceae bacterium]|nr:hypothetical protein [Xanthobacteraceae bacterium]
MAISTAVIFTALIESRLIAGLVADLRVGTALRAAAARAGSLRAGACKPALRLALAGRFFFTEFLFMEPNYSIQSNARAKNIVPKKLV